MVTREDIEQCCELGLKTLCFKLLAERDAYREVAYISRGRLGYKAIDAEAKRIVEGKSPPPSEKDLSTEKGENK